MTTEKGAQDQARDLWSAHVDSNFLPSAAHEYTGSGDFQGTLVSQETERFRLNYWHHSGEHRMRRGAAESTGPVDHDYRFVLPIAGKLVASHAGAEMEFAPGTASLMQTTGAPFEIRGSWSQGYALKVPSKELEEQLGDARGRVLRADVRTGLGRVVVGMLKYVYEERGNLTADEFDTACEKISELLCALFTGHSAAQEPRSDAGCAHVRDETAEGDAAGSAGQDRPGPEHTDPSDTAVAAHRPSACAGAR